MSTRSVPGFLATLLAVCAVAALGLTAARLDGYALGEHAAMLRGPAVVTAVLGLGVLAWVGLAGAEALVGRRGAQVVAALAVLAAPWGIRAVEQGYWDRSSYVSVWETGAAGEWRGVVGGDCGFVTAVRLRLDATGNGVGTGVPTSVFSPLYTLAIALSPLDGPAAIPVRAHLLDGRLLVIATADVGWTAEGDTLGSAWAMTP